MRLRHTEARAQAADRLFFAARHMIAASTAPLLLAATNRKGWDRASPESTGLSVRRHAHGAHSASDPPTCAPPPPLDAAAAKLLGRVDVRERRCHPR